MADVVKKRVLSLQGLRSVACIMIFLCHSGVVWESWGGWAVSVFFVMSGFLMYRSYVQKDLPASAKATIDFAIKKIRKLYPLHILMLIAALGIDLLLFITGKTDETLMHIILRAVPSVLLVQAWIPVERVFYGFNGVSWFLSCYVFMLLIFPLLMRRMQKGWSNKHAVLLIAGCFGGLICVSFAFAFLNLQSYSVWFFYIFPVTRLVDFIIGMQAAYLLGNCRKTLSCGKVSVIEIAALAASVIGVYVLSFITPTGVIGNALLRNVIVFLPVSVALVCTASLGSGIFGKLICKRAFTYIGDISMYVFLIHNVVLKYLHIIIGYFIEPVPKLLLTVGGVIVTAFAVFVYKWADRLYHKEI